MNKPSVEQPSSIDKAVATKSEILLEQPSNINQFETELNPLLEEDSISHNIDKAFEIDKSYVRKNNNNKDDETMDDDNTTYSFTVFKNTVEKPDPPPIAKRPLTENLLSSMKRQNDTKKRKLAYL